MMISMIYLYYVCMSIGFGIWVFYVEDVVLIERQMKILVMGIGILSWQERVGGERNHHFLLFKYSIG